MRLMPPRSAASWSASRTRSSLSMNCWTYRVDAGTPSRSASTTGLRPTTISDVPLPPRPLRVAGRPCVRRACAVAMRFFLWPLRISAGGVGPLPSRPRRRWPPLPTCAPFLPDMRRLLAAMTYQSL